jgi:A/G-specific adenine glycosylase
VASFAFGARTVVLDTNVRRVLARALTGAALPGPSVTAAERILARDVLPLDPLRASRWAAASMELGALVCTARSPQCPVCPLSGACQWLASGRPGYDGPPRRTQRYEGTDRFVRGLLLAALRSTDHPVGVDDLIRAAPDPVLKDPGQRDRCLDGLVADGLIEPLSDHRFRLPTSPL